MEGRVVASTRQRAGKIAGSDTNGDGKATRRPRGEPRRLLLEAARELFAHQGYNGTSTREIADAAGVSETLMFRYFGSKVGLFREALVVPFIELVEDFNAKWQSGSLEDVEGEVVAREFLTDLFDLFRKNRGLVVMLWAADTQRGSELAESGVFDEITRELRVLANVGAAETLRRHAPQPRRHDLATRSTIAMVAGMAVFGESFYGKRLPARKDIIEELTQATLHGRLHRSG
jgi:AcrR family transcriptional regulator